MKKLTKNMHKAMRQYAGLDLATGVSDAVQTKLKALGYLERDAKYSFLSITEQGKNYLATYDKPFTLSLCERVEMTEE